MSISSSGSAVEAARRTGKQKMTGLPNSTKPVCWLFVRITNDQPSDHFFVFGENGMADGEFVCLEWVLGGANCAFLGRVPVGDGGVDKVFWFN